MVFETLKLGDHRTNCYLFGPNNENIVLIDPGYEGEEIYRLIKQNSFKIKYIILTHGHYDHIGQVKFIKALVNAQVLIHRDDAQMLTDPYQNLSSYVSFNQVAADKADKLLEDGETLILGDSTMRVIHTPGHTKGGICIFFEDCLFSGDTLFRETVGRTDLPHSNHNDMLESIEKLMKFQDEIKVFPGHGDFTTIGHERRNNPFVDR